LFIKSNYIRLPNNSQPRLSASSPKKKSDLLAQGCRGPLANRRVVYLATPIDQFHGPSYGRVRSLITARFPAHTWAIFEPARCTWTTADWLNAWPRLIRCIGALVIWPRLDGSVGFGVYQEACDIECKGKPVYVIKAGQLKSFKGFSLLKCGPFRYARVRTGRTIQAGATLMEGR
jgi:hypothetical protein